MENYELTHHGVKGMKWGIRRVKKKSGYGRDRDNDDDSDSHEDSKKVRDGKSARKMSDAELRERINRIQMEKQYKQLTAQEKSAGRKFITDVLSQAAKETAKNYAAQYMKKGIDALIKKATERRSST